ncbi:ubiquinol-cytochrome C chaperone family protein [bacterium]|nr:ubiquinol-cytochrome C chaperone family protein [bacterium]
MILQYFKTRENKEQIIARNQYKKILYESKNFLNENNFFKIKNYKTSFEIVSIFLIMFIRKNLLDKNRKKYLRVNEELISIFISDLDESLRVKGIGDMSIGKYVKSYVKKFYFRISKFPVNNNLYNNESFIKYLKLTNLIVNEDYTKISRKFNDKFNDFIKSSN